MRGWSSFLIGLFLLGLAYWSYAAGGFGSSTVAFGAAAAVFFLRGAYGMAAGEAGNAGDPAAIIEFVTNPASAIVDTAADRLGDWLQDDQPAAAADTSPEQSRFDPDAALARYLEKRGAEPASTPAAVRAFGRKGVA